MTNLNENNDNNEIKLVLIISCIVSVMFIFSNEKPTGIYDEILANGQPHHELIESGYPFPARSYWTQCTTGWSPQTNWYPLGIILDSGVACGLVFSTYYIGKQIKQICPRVGEQQK